jgi:hypothetical protein
MSVSIGQNVSTLSLLGHHQVSPFLSSLAETFSTLRNATYGRCLFYMWLKCIHMVKILFIQSYMAKY